jgi:hypothetical protein
MRSCYFVCVAGYVLLQIQIQCRKACKTTAWKNVPLYFVKYSQHRKMFQIQTADLDVTYARFKAWPIFHVRWTALYEIL